MKTNHGLVNLQSSKQGLSLVTLRCYSYEDSSCIGQSAMLKSRARFLAI